MPGTGDSAVEVANISRHGFWIFMDDRELFLPFDEFPWLGRPASLRSSTLSALEPIICIGPDIDVDLTVDSIEHPDRYPLRARVQDASEGERSES